MKVFGFGIATHFTPGEKLYDRCGTVGYMAPEVSEHGYEGPPVDVWSLGILFTTILVGLKYDGSAIIKVSIVYNGVMIIITNSCHHCYAQSCLFEHNYSNSNIENTAFAFESVMDRSKELGRRK